MVGLVVEIFLVSWKLIINKSSQQFSDHSPLHLHLLRHRQDTNRALLNPTGGVTTSAPTSTPSSTPSSSTVTTSTRVWTWWPWGVFCTFRLVLTAFWTSTSSLHWLDWDGTWSRTDTGLICQYRHRTQTINYQISVLSYLLKFLSYLPSVTTIWTSRMVSSVNSSPSWWSCWLKLITSVTSISSRVKEVVKEVGREGQWETGREAWTLW